jgi:hypothetical protein
MEFIKDMFICNIHIDIGIKYLLKMCDISNKKFHYFSNSFKNSGRMAALDTYNEVNLSLYLTEHHVMKVYGGVEV